MDRIVGGRAWDASGATPEAARFTTPHSLAEYSLGRLPLRFVRGLRDLLDPDERILYSVERPGIMATDACVKTGLRMAEMSPATVAKLKEKLPPTSNFSIPIDVIGDAQHDRYEHALRCVIAEPNVDGVMVLLTCQMSVSFSHR